MKITKKYLEKLIQEELQSLIIEQPGTGSAAAPTEPNADVQIIAAIDEGLRAKGIKPRDIRITDTRSYRGSGTGFTVEFDTDIGAIKFNEE